MKVPTLLAAAALTFSLTGCAPTTAPPAAAPAAPALPTKCTKARAQINKLETAYNDSPDGYSLDRIAWANLYFFVDDQNAKLGSAHPDRSHAAWFLDNYGECLSSEAYDMLAYWRDNFAN